MTTQPKNLPRITHSGSSAESEIHFLLSSHDFWYQHHRPMNETDSSNEYPTLTGEFFSTSATVSLFGQETGIVKLPNFLQKVSEKNEEGEITNTISSSSPSYFTFQTYLNLGSEY